MDADERQILEFIEACGEQGVSAAEVCRRVGGKKRFYEDPNWAKPILQRMKDEGTVLMDPRGRYRVKTDPKRHGDRWVSPEIDQILREGGIEGNAEPAAGEPED